jgi:hypothetical protein
MYRMGKVRSAGVDAISRAMKERMAQGEDDFEVGTQQATPEWDAMPLPNSAEELVREVMGKHSAPEAHDDESSTSSVFAVFEKAGHWYTECVLPYLSWNLFLGDPVLSNYVFLVILYFAYSRVSADVLILATAFQFNLNPVYVLPLFAFYKLFFRRGRAPKQFVSVTRRAPSEHNRIDAPLDSEYDHIILGSTVSSLYTAALLSKCGHRCCVVMPSDQGPQLKV